MQPLDLVERHVGAGRIVRIGEKDNLGARAQRRQNGVDVGGEALFRRHDRLGSRTERGDRIDQKSVRRVDRLVAVAQIGIGEEIEQIVGAGPAHDAIGIEPEGASDGFAQCARRPVRIVRQPVGDRPIGRDRVAARAERRLVGRQLEHAATPGAALLPGT